MMNDACRFLNRGYSPYLAILLAWAISPGTSSFTADAPAVPLQPSRCGRSLMNTASPVTTPRPKRAASISSISVATGEEFDAWVKVYDRVRAGEMPPEGPQEAAQKAEAEAILKSSMRAWSCRSCPIRGRGPGHFRRLNRTEYENTLRDLFDLPGLKIKDTASRGRQGVRVRQVRGRPGPLLRPAVQVHGGGRPRPGRGHRPTCRPAAHFKVHIPGSGAHVFVARVLGHTVFLKDFKYDDSIMPVLDGKIKKDAEAKKLKRDNLKEPATTAPWAYSSPRALGSLNRRFHLPSSIRAGTRSACRCGVSCGIRER